MTSTYVEINEIRSQVTKLRREGSTIGFVPTMGALHDGHISLVKKALEECNHCIVSIFINPKQFGPNEDFSSYPRMIRNDVDLLKKHSVQAIFIPNTSTIYPRGYSTTVSNQSNMPNVLCGQYREGHFDGVLTIVLKLLNIVAPDKAYFGKKDYQQLALIHRMAEDLNIPVEIIGGEIVRETDGLAMSSRNLRLTDEQRKIAPKIYESLQFGKRLFDEGVHNPSHLIEKVSKKLNQEAPEIQMQYIEIREQASLNPVAEKISSPSLLALAAFLGDVRLIDNIELG